MDVSLITEPGRFGAGSGALWQSAAVDSSILQLPRRFVLVEMARGIDPTGLIDTAHFAQLLDMSIDDSPAACLPDDLYLALNDASLLYLLRGFDLVSGCGAGVSRSSYKSLGILIAGLGLTTDNALLLLRQGRPQANPNPGFLAHVRSLEPILLGRFLTLQKLL